jgi:hypothetical protein
LSPEWPYAVDQCVERLGEFSRVDEQEVIVTVAADFCNGGTLSFERVFGHKGEENLGA